MSIDDPDYKKTQRHILWSLRIVTFTVTAALIGYVYFFAFINRAPLSTDPASWGQLGDYFGGLLNPLIAFFAFFWLSQSILIQKKELSETKQALQKAQEAQTQQATLSLIGIKLQNLNIQLEFLTSECSNLTAYQNTLIQQAAVHGLQYTVITKFGIHEKLESLLPQINDSLSQLNHERLAIIEKAKNIAAELA